MSGRVIIGLAVVDLNFNHTSIGGLAMVRLDKRNHALIGDPAVPKKVAN